MKKLTKKIIAREFLFLLTSIFLLFTIMLFWKLLNNTSENKVNITISKIESLRNRLPSDTIVLTESFRIQLDAIVSSMTLARESEGSIQEVVNFYKEQYGVPEEALSSKLEKIVSVNLKKDTSSKELQKIIKNYREEFIVNRNKYDNNFVQLSKLNRKIENSKKSFFYNNIAENNLSELIMITAIIFFGIRYVFYATKWSLKQLKE